MTRDSTFSLKLILSREKKSPGQSPGQTSQGGNLGQRTQKPGKCWVNTTLFSVVAAEQRCDGVTVSLRQRPCVAFADRREVWTDQRKFTEVRHFDRRKKTRTEVRVIIEAVF